MVAKVLADGEHHTYNGVGQVVRFAKVVVCTSAAIAIPAYRRGFLGRPDQGRPR